MTKIIGISGLIGSGKDTVADYLVNYHGFRRESFASTLKDAVAAVFGWDRMMLEGRTRSSREWREQVDTWWAKRLDMPDLTPRWVLQYWGTDVLRDHFHNQLWVASLENKLRLSQDNIVISDVRFPNEVAAIRNSGGQLVCVERGPKPQWYQDAQDGTNMRDCWPNVHPSEYSWITTQFDLIIDNNSTIDQLYQQIHQLIVKD